MTTKLEYKTCSKCGESLPNDRKHFWKARTRCIKCEKEGQKAVRDVRAKAARDVRKAAIRKVQEPFKICRICKKTHPNDRKHFGSHGRICCECINAKLKVSRLARKQGILGKNEEPFKTCTICKKNQPNDDKHFGLHCNQCRSCINEKGADARKSRQDGVLGKDEALFKTCTICSKELPNDNQHFRIGYNQCKNCKSEEGKMKRKVRKEQVILESDLMYKKCSECGEDKPDDYINFPLNQPCRECLNKRKRLQSAEIAERRRELTRVIKCVSCPYEGPRVAFVFQYKNRDDRLKTQDGKKYLRPSKIHPKVLETQLPKIDAFCKNCYRIRRKAYNEKSASQTKIAVQERIRAAKRREIVNAEKRRRGKCDQCGFLVKEDNFSVFEFDHIDRKTKIDSVSFMAQHYKEADVIAEMAKCRMLCARDHAIKSFLGKENYVPKLGSEEPLTSNVSSDRHSVENTSVSYSSISDTDTVEEEDPSPRKRRRISLSIE